MQQTTNSPLFLSCAKHPYCQTCGWRKGGTDSWNGRACKCGDYAPPMRPLHVPLRGYGLVLFFAAVWMAAAIIH